MSINISDFTVTADNSSIITNDSNIINKLKGKFIGGLTEFNMSFTVTGDGSFNVKLYIKDTLMCWADNVQSGYKLEKRFPLPPIPYISDMVLIVKAVATDLRGVSVSESKSVMIEPYAAPKLIPETAQASVLVFRCDDSGQQTDTGTKAKIRAVMKAQGSLNEIELDPKIYIRTKTVSESWNDKSFSEVQYYDSSKKILSIAFNITDAYNVQLKVEDAICSSEIYEFELPSENMTYDAAPGGKKVAFGGSANSLPHDDMFGIYWDTWMKKNLDVEGKTTLNEAEIASANVTDSVIENAIIEKLKIGNASNKINLEYIKKSGILYTDYFPFINTLNEDSSTFNDEMVDKYLLIFGKEYTDYLQLAKIPWEYHLWDLGRIELSASIPFIYFRIIEYTLNNVTINYSNIDQLIIDNNDDAEKLGILNQYKEHFQRNKPVACGRNNEFFKFDIPTIAYPSEVLFNHIPQEFASYYADIFPSWLSGQGYNNTNSKTYSQKYSLIAATNTIRTHENGTAKAHFFGGIIRLFVKGYGTITEQEE